MKLFKVRLKFLALLFLTVLYVIFFPAASGKELFLTPTWVTDVETTQVSRSVKNGEVFPFRLQRHLGYIDEQGKLLFREDITYDAAIGPDFFVNYPAVPLHLVIRGQRGEFLGNISENGYPFVLGGDLYVISPDGHSLSRVDKRGETLWKKTFASLITVADKGKAGLVLGFLNGAFAVLSDDGTTLHEVPAGHEALSVALQAGIADDALYFACLVGGSPQRLKLYVKRDSSYELQFESALNSTYRRAFIARYFSEPDYFVFEQPGGAAVFQVEKENLLFPLKLPGQLLSLAPTRPNGLFICLSSSDRMHCEGFLPNGSRVFGFSYNAARPNTDDQYFLFSLGNSILLGEVSRLYFIRLEVL